MVITENEFLKLKQALGNSLESDLSSSKITIMIEPDPKLEKELNKQKRIESSKDYWIKNDSVKFDAKINKALNSNNIFTVYKAYMDVKNLLCKDFIKKTELKDKYMYYSKQLRKIPFIREDYMKLYLEEKKNNLFDILEKSCILKDYKVANPNHLNFYQLKEQINYHKEEKEHNLQKEKVKDLLSKIESIDTVEEWYSSAEVKELENIIAKYPFEQKKIDSFEQNLHTNLFMIIGKFCFDNYYQFEEKFNELNSSLEKSKEYYEKSYVSNSDLVILLQGVLKNEQQRENKNFDMEDEERE